MNIKPMAAVLGLVFIVASFLFGCTSPERTNTKVSMGVFLNKEIRIDKMKVGEDSLAFADVVAGDSTLFLYSEYTDQGEEGYGYEFGFHIDPKSDSATYSPTGMEKRIIGFGTGMAPNFADTIESYEFSVSMQGDAVRIAGKVGEMKITGTYLPK